MKATLMASSSAANRSPLEIATRVVRMADNGDEFLMVRFASYQFCVGLTHGTLERFDIPDGTVPEVAGGFTRRDATPEDRDRVVEVLLKHEVAAGEGSA